eukprot:TRINITY_DN17138_c0_g1_i1.p1 TRINITY_DN17138_c0_g1~~TRINITY_DN17138_c0_g1_i1.p1  ORF type:complete len:118 (+),score=0.06 TRINITY_DN17138_c0_g1_i1:45-398(+)
MSLKQLLLLALCHAGLCAIILPEALLDAELCGCKVTGTSVPATNVGQRVAWRAVGTRRPSKTTIFCHGKDLRCSNVNSETQLQYSTKPHTISLANRCSARSFLPHEQPHAAVCPSPS